MNHAVLNWIEKELYKIDAMIDWHKKRIEDATQCIEELVQEFHELTYKKNSLSGSIK